MLDVKKLLVKILQRITVRTVTYTGTTSANGSLYLNTVPANANVISMKSSSNAHLVIPFRYSNDTWYAKVVAWQSLNNVNNTSVTLTVKYWGGYFITSLLSTLRGWRYVRREETAYEDARIVRYRVKRKLAVCHSWAVVHRCILKYRDTGHQHCGRKRVPERFKQHHHDTRDVIKQRIFGRQGVYGELRRMVVSDKQEHDHHYLQSHERNIKGGDNIQHFCNRRWYRLTTERGCVAC